MLRVYNTKTHSVEDFIPVQEGKVKMYGCGPTVYNLAHIGNLRAFVFYDVLNRVLRYKGYDVTFAMNITDVDDKTIRDSAASGKTLKEFTRHYTELFFKDWDMLNLKRPDKIICATDEIEAMIDLVNRLLEKGYAYKAESGDVFFKISSFKEYGQMAGIDPSRMLANADGRLADEYDKEDARDFALWKAWSPRDGDNVWEAPFGRGRPGWHIECSAMAHKYLGQPFDIHMGGVDLVFPHHTNEIAQSECAYGCEFVRYWMHNEHITVNGQKMSKSLGNCFTLSDLLAKGYSPAAIRYEFIKSHYHQRMDFMESNLSGNQTVINRFEDFLKRLSEVKSGAGWSELPNVLQRASEGFEKGLDDDLNLSVALASVFELMNAVNKNFVSLSVDDAEKITKQMRRFDEVLGIMPEIKQETLQADIQALIDRRQACRLVKDWAAADALKQELLSLGIEVKDTPQGPVWRRI
ncbi:MAG: cysteine--tRNA ligase [Alphaproteobacteria bacterium]|nr:cysteine--tRNA ligase [Alphaproteobacteria bacterium]